MSKSNIFHLDPTAIALEKRRQREEASAEQNSQPVAGSQPTESSQPATGWQPSEQPPAGPVSCRPVAGSQPVLSSQPARGSHSILESVPEVAGHTEQPHRYTDHLCRWLSPDEQAIYTQLYRLSWGWGKDTCLISNPKLSERSNVPLSTMKRAVGRLVDKGLVAKTDRNIGYGKDQGVEYRVPRLGRQPAQSRQPGVSSQPTASPIKEGIKETIKEERCAECRNTGGFKYMSKNQVLRCDHGGRGKQ